MRVLRLVATGLLVLSLSACTKDSSDSGSGDRATDSGQLAGSCSLRVMNGEGCADGQGPVARIVLTKNGQDYALCTGTFLSSTFVLTAGHCIESFGGDGARVWSGQEEVEVANFFVHPRYQGSAYSTPEPTPYDVALLELSRPIAVETLPLLASRTAAAGDTLNIIGFGLNEDQPTGSADAQLHKGTMQISDYQGGLILATADSSGATACPGDSGGPGILLAESGKPAVAGVASLGAGTSADGLTRCEGVVAAVYADVGYDPVLSWILGLVPTAETI